MITWRIKKGVRFKPGHPWVMISDIDSIGKNFVPGSPVLLQNFEGQFLAYGYGNPDSNIAFRALSFRSQEKDFFEIPVVLSKTLECWKRRKNLGYNGSFRMVFSEADFLPGLIIDYYVGHQNSKKIQVLAVQILTAGMQKILQQAEVFFRQLLQKAIEENLTDVSVEQSAVVLRNDVRSREVEGIGEEPPRFIYSVKGADFTDFPILLNSMNGLIEMSCDLFQGQKTGFFLDQTQNIKQVCDLVKNSKLFENRDEVKILDLCSYVGHWSAQLSRTFKSMGITPRITQVDISSRALGFARKNAEKEGAVVESLEGDLFKVLPTLKCEYDIVISDPPAFVKSKKDLHVGAHAYTKMNHQAARVTKENGLLVSCSCSGLFTEEIFKDSLKKAFTKSGTITQCVLRGGPAMDHPGRLEFPEGMYLKMFTHSILSHQPVYQMEADGCAGEEP